MEATRECCSDSLLIDLRMSLCMRPAAEKTRSTPADDAGEARNCLAIFASLGHLLSCGGGSPSVLLLLLLVVPLYGGTHLARTSGSQLDCRRRH